MLTTVYKDGWYCIGDKDFTYHRAHKKSVITRGRTWEKKDYGVRCTLNSCHTSVCTYHRNCGNTLPLDNIFIYDCERVYSTQ